MIVSEYLTKSELNAQWLRENYDVRHHYPRHLDIIEYLGKRWMVDWWDHGDLKIVHLISWEGKTLWDAMLAVAIDEKTGIRRMGSLFREKHSGWLVAERSKVIARFADNYVPIDLTGGAT